MPGREDAWAFVWKALRHVHADGLVAFLLPAMGFLHNHAQNSLAARRQLVRESRVRRIINFADLRFQLFDGPIRPTALLILGENQEPGAPYEIEYWAPKADLNLQIKRTITLSSADKFTLSSTGVQSDALVFKHRLWMREPEIKLFGYLSKLPTLASFIKKYRSMRGQNIAGKWVIGMGYQPFNEPTNSERSEKYAKSKLVGTLPDLPIDAFRALVVDAPQLRPWPSHRVRRKGFEAAFSGSRIIVPRTTSQGRLRAAYAESDFTFQDIIQAITVPKGERARGKLLTALLNSKVAAWFAFHGTASFGSERPEVKQSELLRLPFPAADDLPEPSRAQIAADKLIALIDAAVGKLSNSFTLNSSDNPIPAELDKWAYEYFCLSDDEIILIEDTIDRVVPAVQPHQGSYPDLWKQPTTSERQKYAATLMRSVDDWLQTGTHLRASLEAKNGDLGVLRLELSGNNTAPAYSENQSALVDDALSRIMQHIHQPLEGNFQLMPDLRVFIGTNLYLVKPMQRRFWLRSTALADADAIAADLQQAIDIDARRKQAQ
jgi:hypothetical protein